MIVIEGPDGAGKTRLAQRLSHDLEIPIATRVVSSDTHPMFDLVEWVQNNIEVGLTRTIFDRHRLISEPIYGPVLRKCQAPGFEDMGWLRTTQRSWRQLGPLVIFCLPPLEEVLLNLDQANQPEQVILRAETIYWLYFNQASLWSPLHTWDYTKDGYNDVRNLVVDFARRKGLRDG